MARYPNTIINLAGQPYDFITITTEEILAEHFNRSFEEIAAIESELGTNVSGSQDDLKTRLSQAVDSDGYIYTTKAALLEGSSIMHNTTICVVLTNKHGSTVEIGDIVSIHSSIDKAFVLTSSDNDQKMLGVIVEDDSIVEYQNDALAVVCIKGFAICKKDTSESFSHGQVVTSSNEPGTVKPADESSGQNVIGIVTNTVPVVPDGYNPSDYVEVYINPTKGTSGFSGLTSASGYSGQIGYSGLIGISGWSGYVGILGASGYSGTSTTIGTSGLSGTSGYSGQSGYSGDLGPTGLDGLMGPLMAGTSGVSGYSGTGGKYTTKGKDGVVGKSGYTGTLGYSGIRGSQDFGMRASLNDVDSPLASEFDAISIWGEAIFNKDVGESIVVDKNYDWKDRYIKVDLWYRHETSDITNWLPGGSNEHEMWGIYCKSINKSPSYIMKQLAGGMFYSANGNASAQLPALILDQLGNHLSSSSEKFYIYVNQDGKVIIERNDSSVDSMLRWAFVLHITASSKQNHCVGN